MSEADLNYASNAHLRIGSSRLACTGIACGIGSNKDVFLSLVPNWLLKAGVEQISDDI